MFLAERAAFLMSSLFRDSDVVGTSTLTLALVSLSGAVFGAFFSGLILGVGVRYYFFNVLKNAQLFPNALGERILREIILILPRLGAHAL